MSEQQEPNLTSMINSIKDDLTSLVTSHVELAQAEAKEAERQAILDRLGLTADEAKLILG